MVTSKKNSTLDRETQKYHINNMTTRQKKSIYFTGKRILNVFNEMMTLSCFISFPSINNFDLNAFFLHLLVGVAKNDMFFVILRFTKLLFIYLTFYLLVQT